MNENKNLPIEAYDDVLREITPLDILIGAGIGLSVGLGAFVLYLKHCQEHKGIIIREVK